MGQINLKLTVYFSSKIGLVGRETHFILNVQFQSALPLLLFLQNYEFTTKIFIDTLTYYIPSYRFVYYWLFWPLYSKLNTRKYILFNEILITKLFSDIARKNGWQILIRPYWIPHQAFSSLLKKKKKTIERDEKNTSMTTHSFLIFTKGVGTKTVWATPISLPP